MSKKKREDMDIDERITAARNWAPQAERSPEVVPARTPAAWPEDHELVAKKDFVIVWNDYRREIKVGDVLTDVPEMFYENLKTEGVI